MNQESKIVEFPKLSEIDRQFEELERQRELILKQKAEILRLSCRGTSQGNLATLCSLLAAFLSQPQRPLTLQLIDCVHPYLS